MEAGNLESISWLAIAARWLADSVDDADINWQEKLWGKDEQVSCDICQLGL